MDDRDRGRKVVALRESNSAQPAAAAVAAQAGRRTARRLAPARELAAPVVGECLDAEHPTLPGRVRVRWSAGAGRWQNRWLPTLHRLAVREGDRVLVVRPAGWPEPIVTGVVDGYAERPEAAARPAAVLQLGPDETLRVCSRAGAPLLEISDTESGPRLRLLGDDLDLEVEGDLRLRGRRVQIEAARGELELSARDDVNVRGESINLN